MTWTSGYDTAKHRVGYTHLIRAEGDPQEMSRGHGSKRQKRWGGSPHLTIKKLPEQDLRKALLEAVDELGEPRTFNAVTVTAFGLTADVVFTTKVNDAWWAMVSEGLIEHTLVAPILWRRRVP